MSNSTFDFVGGGVSTDTSLVMAPEELNPELMTTTKLYKLTLPIKIRKAFVARPGFYLLSGDYKAIEFRIMLLMAHEDGVIEEIKNGLDVHVETAKFIFGLDKVSDQERDAAKVFNYGLSYGMDVSGIRDRLKCTDEQARHYYNKFFERMPSVTQWLEEVKQFAKRNGYVKTYFGRKRYLRDVTEAKNEPTPQLRRKRFARGMRGAVNTVVQGTAADIMRIALARCGEAIKPYMEKDLGYNLGSIHDQMLSEFRNEVPLSEAVHYMKSSMEFPIPGWALGMEVDFSQGPSWAGLKKIKFEKPEDQQKVVVCVSPEVSKIPPEVLKGFRGVLQSSPGKCSVVVLWGQKAIPCADKVKVCPELLEKLVVQWAGLGSVEVVK